MGTRVGVVMGVRVGGVNNEMGVQVRDVGNGWG